jgi:peptidoglycan/LPS O-acetylase OafA/YrhL
MAFPITLGFSIFSWKIIEQPFLELKRHIVKRKHKIDLEDGATREEIEDATWKTFEPGTEV